MFLREAPPVRLERRNPHAPLVLIADDQPDALLLLELILGEEYRIVAAASGPEALEALGKGPPPDIILLDVMMPGMDGFEVCTALKSSPATRDIPVIFLTASNRPEDEEQGLSVGGVDFIHKPFSGPGLLLRVRNQLRLARAERVLRQSNEALEQAVAERTAVLQRQSEILARREREFAALVDQVPDLIFRLDRTHRPVFGNAVCARLLGTVEDPGGLSRLAELLRGEADAIDAVLTRGQEREREVNRFGSCFRLRLVPERDCSGSIVSVLGIGEDVTERVRVANALHESEQRLTFALERTQTGLWDFSPQSGRLVLSDSYFTMLGYQPGDFPATYEDGWKALLHPDDKERAVAAFEGFAEPSGERTYYSAQFRVRSRQGEWRWINSRGTAVERDAEGRAVRIVGVHLDITAQRLAEAEQRFRSDVLEHALNGFSIVDGNGNFLYANRAHLALWGYQRLEELVRSSPASHFVDPDMPARIIMALRERQEGTFEFKGRRRNGSTFDVMMAGKRYIDPDGRELFTGSSIDVSERIRAGAVIREAQERLLSWTTATSSILWWADARLELAPPQPSFQAVTGFAPQRLENHGWVEALHPDDRREVLSRRRASTDSGELYECEARIWHAPSQRYRWYLERGVPRRDQSGAVLGWAGISIDIQRQKEAESALQEADRRKDEFLAMLGHELRNPLAAISTVGEIVCRHAQVSAPLASAGEILTRQTAHLSRLVDDLLDVSRLLYGKVALRSEAVDLTDLARQIASDQRPQFALRGQELLLTLPAEPVIVDGDPVRLAQVFENLLSNAGKYSPDGGEIRLQVSSDPGFAVIRVQDDGAGIPDDLLPSVFSTFTQGPRSLDRPQGGLGIGLTIVKQLVDLHGGQITVSSAGVGHGSEFRFSLPLRHGAAGGERSDPIPPAAADSGAPLRVLLVDDNRDAAAALAFLLDQAGHAVENVADGPAALAVAGDFRPDVVLLDIGLPGMDGFEVARQLRARMNLPRVRLIAVTGYGDRNSRAKAAAAGIDLFLTKPVKVRDLLQVMVAACRQHQDIGDGQRASGSGLG